MSKADMEQLRRSRLTAQRSSMLLDVEKRNCKAQAGSGRTHQESKTKKGESVC